MKTVARRTPIEPLPVRLRDGSTPIVVALPDDSLEYVISMTDRFGGHANVFVAFPEKLKLIDFQMDHNDTSDNGDQHGHSSMTMAMYVAFLGLTEGTPASLKVNVSGNPGAQSVHEIAYAF
ncbi:hypothetical protein [Microbacterium sp.]|uniref:hypothetical protein n=1 Tax=Microbacterium sp. TaxID=51671 RepID=UPI003A91125E